MGCLVRPVTDSRGKAVKKGRFLACMLPSGRTGWVPKADVADFSAWTASRHPDGESIVETAMRFLGVPYMWGGTSIKEADCSGFVLCTYFMNGILLPRNTSQQVRAGVPVELDSLQPGDLLFFGTPATDDKPERINHVGIYIGNDRFIHSSQLVRINSLIEGQPDYYARKPIRACRIIGNQDCGKGVVSIANSGVYFNK
jgi:cell wall-associated NlpC family hydrolase